MEEGAVHWGSEGLIQFPAAGKREKDIQSGGHSLSGKLGCPLGEGGGGEVPGTNEKGEYSVR